MSDQGKVLSLTRKPKGARQSMQAIDRKIKSITSGSLSPRVKANPMPLTTSHPYVSMSRNLNAAMKKAKTNKTQT